MASESETSLKADFGKAQSAYSAYRPTYPALLFEKIIAWVPEDRRDVAVDIGAGTGLSTVPLCAWFRKVVAVEPDASMAQQIHGLHPNIEVVQSTAEQYRRNPESVDLVTAGNAFYWTEGMEVMRSIVTWLRRRGVVALYRYSLPQAPAPIQDLINEEMERHWNRFRHDRLRNEEYSRVIMESVGGLSDIEVIQVANVVDLSPEGLVGFFESTSYGSAYIRSIADSARYVSQLIAAVAAAAGSGSIPVDFGLELILGSKE